jgi:hypothetical protein
VEECYKQPGTWPTHEKTITCSTYAHCGRLSQAVTPNKIWWNTSHTDLSSHLPCAVIGGSCSHYNPNWLPSILWFTVTGRENNSNSREDISEVWPWDKFKEMIKYAISNPQQSNTDLEGWHEIQKAPLQWVLIK